MDAATLKKNVYELSQRFAAQRAERQLRRSLDRADFDALRDAGYLLVGVPAEEGGLWEGVGRSARVICQALRTLAGGDSSVALVSAMHPAVLSYWLTAPDEAANYDGWQAQCQAIFSGVLSGDWWGTITSEPGSGGDVARTRTIAKPAGPPLQYTINGQKHFGSGTGEMAYMVTTALAEGESDPDWFYVDMRGAKLDGTKGAKLVAEWDGHGMTATQSHGVAFEEFPATRIAWTGNLTQVATLAGPFIGCLFSSVIVGIVDAAIESAGARLKKDEMRSFEKVEWARARMEGWLISQALEGMLRAVEEQADPRRDVLQGKTAIAELAESVMRRLCQVMGGGTFARRSPFGHWFEDVRALGFLRPPWGLAYETLIEL